MGAYYVFFPGKFIKHPLLLVLCYVKGTFRCTFCQTEVEEDESVCPDARTLVARFNEQIEPIYVLLRETEDVNLSHDLLEPEPTEIPALKQRSVSDKSCRNTPLSPFSQHHVTTLQRQNAVTTCLEPVSDFLTTDFKIFSMLNQKHLCGTVPLTTYWEFTTVNSNGFTVLAQPCN